MFERLADQPPDKIIALGQAYRADPRPEKIDLGVGVYKNADGVTPIMRAVKAAETRLLAEETTKSYTGMLGEPAFRDALADLILGPGAHGDRRATAATPGGTGAVRQGFELVMMARPGARVWVSDPTWPNHSSILKHLKIETKTYRYFDAATRGVDFDGMMADLASIGPDDVVLLHGCCHNPTGANLDAAQWQAVTAHLAKTGALPFIDIAYQGFGDGLEEDAAGLRHLVAGVPEAIIAASCSKNFGIYRERTGLLLALGDAAGRDRLQSNLFYLNRQNYSFPPDHGARLVQMILTDDALRADWAAELEAVRSGMLDLRQALADELRQRTNSDRFDFLAHHRGMFSRLGATPEQVETLRRDYAIYMVADSRMNIAGLNAKTVPVLADAIATVGV
ncbi:MAG: amino acid aminotransferase [Paracoccaceae bacterium]|nr:amino acid aminotransferase [Paracoccaceae bacterium]